MGRGKKRTLFTGIKPIGGAAMKSRRVARKVTSQYHQLVKEKSQVANDKALSKQEKKEKLAVIDEKLAEIGGINKYQEASIISTQHFSTSKWIIQAIRRIKPNSSRQKWKTLEVGAINTQLQSSDSLAVRAIDQHSQHPSIEEKDFFTIIPERGFDVVVCSMVINCVTESDRRGEMIAKLCMHLCPSSPSSSPSLLFLILPRRCLSSPFFSLPQHFLSLLVEVFGLSLVEEHYTPKVAFFILQPPSAPSLNSSSPSISLSTNPSPLSFLSPLSWQESMKDTISAQILTLSPSNPLVSVVKRVFHLLPYTSSREGREDFSLTLSPSLFLSLPAKQHLSSL